MNSCAGIIAKSQVDEAMRDLWCGRLPLNEALWIYGLLFGTAINIAAHHHRPGCRDAGLLWAAGIGNFPAAASAATWCEYSPVRLNRTRQKNRAV